MIGRVYQISNLDESIVYIGSTTKTLEKRWGAHLRHFKRWNNGMQRCGAMIYHHFKEYGVESFAIHLVSEHVIENRRQLTEFEQLLIDKTQCVNRCAAYRTQAQLSEQKQQYRAANKEYFNTYAREVVMCECGETYQRGHKTRHQSTQRHRYGIASPEEKQEFDQQLAIDKQLRNDAKHARRTVAFNCECGGKYQHATITVHRKSKRHQAWVISKET